MHERYIIELLDKKQHDIVGFGCGVKELNIYLFERAGQEVKKKVTVVYVIREKDSKRVIGYYTLSAYAIELSNLPVEVTKKLPKYPALPASLIGRFAVDKKSQGKKIGGHLLIDALLRSYKLSREIGSIAVVVEAKDEKSRSFFERYGFKQFRKYPFKLFLPMSTIMKMIKTG